MNGELAAMADLAKRLVTSHTPGTLSTLFAVRGSSYRPLGSMMVSLPGMHAGGISGGCLEEYVARVGERATRTTSAVVLDFDTHRDSDDAVPVLGCGGSIHVLVERLEPQHVTLLEQFADAAECDDRSFLASVVRRRCDSVSVTREWLRPRRGRRMSEDEALARIGEKAMRESKTIHQTIAADTDVLVQYVPALTRLVIFGAGDDARPLCDIGASLGWHVSVADRRARLATRARFPHARTVLAGDWDEAVEATTFSSRTAVVLMTHSLDDDARILSLLSRQPLAYVGALGPAHRREWLIEEASSLATGREDSVARTLRTPIGLDLGDRSSGGIAVAVVAEILAHLNRRDARPLGAATNTNTDRVSARCDAVA